MGPDGSFELMAPRGDYELFLLELAPGLWNSTIRARRAIVLDLSRCAVLRRIRPQEQVAAVPAR